MNAEESWRDDQNSMDHRRERIRIETERHRIEGLLTLARDGYRSRVSDVLNASERDFLTLTDVTVAPLEITFPLLPVASIRALAGRLKEPVPSATPPSTTSVPTKLDPGIDPVSNTVTVPADTLTASQTDFTLPPPLKNAPAGSVYTGGYTEPGEAEGQFEVNVDIEHTGEHVFARRVQDPDRPAPNLCDVAFLQEHEAARDRQQRRHVRSREILLYP